MPSGSAHVEQHLETFSMTIAAFRKPSLSVGARVASVFFGSALLLTTLGATAFQADSSTGRSSTAPVMKGTTGRQLWRLSDYTTVELVARESGAPDNQHPWTIDSETLRAWLQQVTVLRSGKPRPLFAGDELDKISPAIAEALANARPDQDLALVSSAHHEDNNFFSVSAVTARLFVVDGHLNMIVHDARVDFYDAARGSGMAPHFTSGSRMSEGTWPVSSAGATNKRPDWLVLGIVPPAPAPVAPPAPAMAAPVAPVAPVAPAVVAPIPPAPPAPAVAPAEPAAATDAEQRLLTIKRLYDKGLLTKSEYEKKRAEIIKGL
jgi:hypothetical protein